METRLKFRLIYVCLFTIHLMNVILMIFFALLNEEMELPTISMQFWQYMNLIILLGWFIYYRCNRKFNQE